LIGLKASDLYRIQHGAEEFDARPNALVPLPTKTHCVERDGGSKWTHT
jgi:hypothetical protein